MKTKYDAFIADYRAVCEKHGLRLYGMGYDLMYVEEPDEADLDWEHYHEWCILREEHYHHYTSSVKA